MNLPFGLPVIRETSAKKRTNTGEVTALYERKLTEYRDSLEYYKKCILEYASKLDTYDRRSMDNQIAIIESALDMTYVKEQGDKTFELIQDLKTISLEKALINLDKLAISIATSNNKLDDIDRTVELIEKGRNSLENNIEGMAKEVSELDKNVVNRISEILLELQKQMVVQNNQHQTEMITGIRNLHKSVKRGHALLWLIFIWNFLALCGGTIYVLYYLEIIPFW